MATALESTQGFTLVLAAAKTFLERGDSMDLTKDKAVLIEMELSKPAQSFCGVVIHFKRALKKSIVRDQASFAAFSS